MGTVKFGADVIDEKTHVPLIEIEMQGAPPLLFRAEFSLPSKDEAFLFVCELQKILAGMRGMQNFRIDENGELSPEQ